MNQIINCKINFLRIHCFHEEKKIKDRLRTSKKVRFKKGARNLTAQAGLIPVVKFLQKHNIIQLIHGTVQHERGANALYDAVDAIFLPLVAMIGGARSISGVVTVWADSVLCRAAGWVRIPDEVTLGRILKTFKQEHVNNQETLIHQDKDRDDVQCPAQWQEFDRCYVQLHH